MFPVPVPVFSDTRKSCLHLVFDELLALRLYFLSFIVCVLFFPVSTKSLFGAQRLICYNIISPRRSTLLLFAVLKLQVKNILKKKK